MPLGRDIARSIHFARLHDERVLRRDHHMLTLGLDELPEESLLADRSERKPTVARYTLYFSCLQVVCFDNESGPYGEARYYHVVVMCDSFPENKGSTGAKHDSQAFEKA